MVVVELERAAAVVVELEKSATVVGERENVVVERETVAVVGDELEAAAAATSDGTLVAGRCRVAVGQTAEDAGPVEDGFDDGASHGGDDVCGRVCVLCVLFLRLSFCYLC